MPFTVTGAAEVRRTFRAMGDGVQRETLEAAVLYGAQPIVAAAQLLAPMITGPNPRRAPGLLKRSIRAVLRQRRRADRAKVEIGPHKSSGLDAFFGKFVEYGHTIVTRGRWSLGSKDGVAGRKRVKSKGQRIGFVAPKPFLRPALLAAGTQAAARVREYLLGAIAKHGRRT